MFNAIANISLNHIERASTDEFERDILTKASAITLTPITLLELTVAARRPPRDPHIPTRLRLSPTSR